MAINHAEGWQHKKTVSDGLREQRHISSNKDLESVAKEQAAKTIEKAHAARTGEAAKAHVNSKPAASHKTPDVPKTGNSEAEAQKANDAQLRSSKQFIDARDSAKSLNQLQSKAPLARSGEVNITRDAVLQKGRSDQPDAGKNAAQQSAFTLTQVAAKRDLQTKRAEDAAPRQPVDQSKTQKKDAKEHVAGKKAAEDAGKDVVKQKADPAAEAALASKASERMAAVVPNTDVRAAEKPSDRDAADRKLDPKKKGSTTDAAGNVYARSSNAGGELNALLGGFSGEGGEAGEGGATSETGAVETQAAEDVAKDGLPELDPHFHVYSEFDEANPGVEQLKSKAQVYSRHVEKRLVKIAEVDQEVGGRLRDIFETAKLSDRIVGELKDELKEELGTARFLKGLYGGLSA